MSAPIRGGKSRPVKEAFFVRVATPEKPAGLFFNASAFVGKQMPYNKPLATCAMRVKDDVVAFSLLHLTKKTATNIATTEIVMPRGLLRLQRRVKDLKATTLDLKPGDLVLEMDEVFYKLVYTTDENGVAVLDTAADQDDVTFDLPPRGVQLSLYLKSPKVDRTLAISFIGHLGKPGTPETVVRAAAMVLNSIAGLVEFRMLSGIEFSKLPAAPNKWVGRPPARKSEDKVFFELLVNMFSHGEGAGEFVPVGSGPVVVEIDLDSANPTSGYLLYHFTPAESIAEAFDEYRDMVGAAVSNTLSRELGDELTQIIYEVVLGEVDNGTLERLRDAVKDLVAVDVTTREYQTHVVAAV